mgnify:FL=1
MRSHARHRNWSNYHRRLTDGKSLSCYITNNLSKTQILDPNPSGTDNHNGAGTPKLLLTPVVFANQTALALTAAGVTIT